MSFKKLFSLPGKTVVEYSSRRSMVETPPPGTVTDRQDPHKHIWKPQFSCGDQTDESRIAFYNSGFAVCPQCSERKVWRFEEKAGIRENGDTYGTEVFRCQTKGCKWKTSFKYDDGVAHNIHFETRGWPRGIHFYPVSYMKLWCERHDLKAFKQQVMSRNLDGDSVLTLYHSGMMQQALGLDSRSTSKIKKALGKHDGALLTRNVLKQTSR